MSGRVGGLESRGCLRPAWVLAAWAPLRRVVHKSLRMHLCIHVCCGCIWSGARASHLVKRGMRTCLTGSTDHAQAIILMEGSLELLAIVHHEAHWSVHVGLKQP
jgi:hypothetical protein